MDSNRHIYTASELSSEVRELLEDSFGLVWIEAELSNLIKPASGHWYFSLKDKKAQLRCAFFKNRNRLVNFKPENGQQILVRGRVSLYEARGDFQLIVDHIEPVGEGDLQQAYEQLRSKLEEQGLFESAHKKALPSYPTAIGIITSPSGAAIKDIQNVLKRRFPAIPIIIYPSQVQGDSAAKQIIGMLEVAIRRKECDILIIARGGGSLEDLWPFNDERLALAIHSCPIPIVTGIGHETDFTIADFVADLRAPTPSAAAELVTPDQAALNNNFADYVQTLFEQINRSLKDHAQQIDWHEQRLEHLHPEKQISMQREKLDSLMQRIKIHIRTKFDNKQTLAGQLNRRLNAQSPHANIIRNQQKIADIDLRLFNRAKENYKHHENRLLANSHALDAVSPLATLARGYTITSPVNTEQLLRKASDVSEDDIIETRLKSGRIISKVESIHD